MFSLKNKYAAVVSSLKEKARKFRALYNHTKEAEVKNEYVATTAFARAWGEDEPEYSDDDIKTINPAYKGW
jgi:hypothetical protein